MNWEAIPCPLCGSLDAAPLAERLDQPPMAATTVICRQCGLVYLNPRPTTESIAQFYEQEYRTLYEGSDDPATVAARMAARAGHIVATLGPVSGKRILEVGSATGQTLLALRERGATVHGIEPTISYAQHSQRLGIPTHVGGYETFVPEHDFDVIVLSHVLEHLPRPVAALRAIRSWLAPEGKLYVEVPNITSYQWLEIAHVTGFVPETLSAMLHASGLSVVRIWTFGIPGWRGVAYRDYYLAAIASAGDVAVGERADWRAIARRRTRTLNSPARRLIHVAGSLRRQLPRR